MPSAEPTRRKGALDAGALPGCLHRDLLEDHPGELRGCDPHPEAVDPGAVDREGRQEAPAAPRRREAEPETRDPEHLEGPAEPGDPPSADPAGEHGRGPAGGEASRGQREEQHSGRKALSSCTPCRKRGKATKIPNSPRETMRAAMFPRSLHRARAPKSSPVSDSIVVTHPHHPLAGERLTVIFEKARPGAERVVVCEGGPAGRVTLAVGWTDRAPAPLAHRLAMEGLAEFAALAAALHHPPLARRERS